MSEHRARVTPAWLTPKARRYVYRVANAALVVLVGYGLMTEEHALMWAGVLVPVLALADDNAG